MPLNVNDERERSASLSGSPCEALALLCSCGNRLCQRYSKQPGWPLRWYLHACNCLWQDTQAPGYSAHGTYRAG